MSRDDLAEPIWRYAWLLEISGLTVRYYAGQAPPTRSLGWGGADYTDLPCITAVGTQTSKLSQLGGVAEMGSIAVTLTGRQYAEGDEDPCELLLRTGRREATQVARLAASIPHDDAAVTVYLDRSVTGWPTIGGREVFHVGVETLVTPVGTAAGPPRFMWAERAMLDTRVNVHAYDAALGHQPWVTSEVVNWTGRRVRLLRAAITGAALTTADYEEVLRGELDRPPEEADEGSVTVVLSPLTVALKKKVGGDAQRTRLVRTHHLFTRGLRSTVAHTQIFPEGMMLRAANTAPDFMASASITVDSNKGMKDNTDPTLSDGHPRRSAFSVNNSVAQPMEATGAAPFAAATSILVDAAEPSSATPGGGQVVNRDLWDVKAVDLCGGAAEALLAWPQGVAAVVNAAWMPGTVAGAGGAWADVKLTLDGDRPRLEVLRNGATVVGPLTMEFRSDWEEPGWTDHDYHAGQGYRRERREVLTLGIDLAPPDEAAWPNLPETSAGGGITRDQSWTRTVEVRASRGDNRGPLQVDIRGVALAFCEQGERHFLVESDILSALSGVRFVQAKSTGPDGGQRSQVLPIVATAEELDGGGNHVGWRYTIGETRRQQAETFGDWPGREPAEIRAAARWDGETSATILLEMLLSGRGNGINSAGYDRQPLGANLTEDDVWLETFTSARDVGPWTLTLTEDTTIEAFITPILQAMGCALVMKLNRETGTQQLALCPLGLEFAPDSVATVATADVAGRIARRVDARITTRYQIEAGFDEASGDPLVKPLIIDADALGDAGGASGDTLKLALKGLEVPRAMDSVLWALGLVGDLRARYGRPRRTVRLKTHHGKAGRIGLGEVATLALPRDTGAATTTEVVTDWDRATATLSFARYGINGAGWAPALRVSTLVDATHVRVEANRHTSAVHPNTGAAQVDLDYWAVGAPCACVPRGDWAGRTATTIVAINRTTREIETAVAHGLAVGDTIRPDNYDASSTAQRLFVYVADSGEALGAGNVAAKDWL